MRIWQVVKFVVKQGYPETMLATQKGVLEPAGAPIYKGLSLK